jgi:hypothetical protein
MTSALTAPPPPSVELGPVDVFGLVTITLPAEPVAAAVAAVERSPATAAREAWNAPSWKLATASWISRAACWSMLAQAIAAWARPAAIRRFKLRCASFCKSDQLCGKRSVCSCEISCICLNRAGVSIWSDQSLRIGLKLTYQLSRNGWFQASGPYLTGGNREHHLDKQRFYYESDTHRNVPIICF